MPILEITTLAERSAARGLRLSPTQRSAFEGVLLGLERGAVVVLRDTASDGKTTVLNHVRARMGGARVGIVEFLNKLALRSPIAIEEAFVEMIEEALTATDLLIGDDLNRVRDISENCNNPRGGLFEATLAAILEKAGQGGKKLVFATDFAPGILTHRAHTWVIDDLQPADYENDLVGVSRPRSSAADELRRDTSIRPEP
jgi:hypothetical protein